MVERLALTRAFLLALNNPGAALKILISNVGGSAPLSLRHHKRGACLDSLPRAPHVAATA